MKQTMQVSTEERDKGIDLLRIIAMFAVTMLHANLWMWTNPLYESLAICAVDLFGLITGYVCLETPWKLKRFIMLWLHVVFYSVGLYVMGWGLYWGGIIKTIPTASSCLLPVPLAGGYWYFNAYAALFFLIPFMNAVLRRLGQKEFMALLVMAAVVLPVLNLLEGSSYYLQNGYNFIWLTVMYIVGAYLKRFPLATNRRWGVLMYVCCVGVVFLCSHEWLMGHDSFNIVWPPCSMMAVGLFLALNGSKFPPFTSYIISKITPLAFGVYLVHCHPVTWSLLQRGVGSLYYRIEPNLWWYIPVMSICMFVFCLCVDWCRNRLFALLHVHSFAERLAKACPSMLKELEKLDARGLE